MAEAIFQDIWYRDCLLNFVQGGFSAVRSGIVMWSASALDKGVRLGQEVVYAYRRLNNRKSKAVSQSRYDAPCNTPTPRPRC